MAGCCRDRRRPNVPPGAAGRRLSAFGAAQILQAYAERAGLDPVQFVGHSLHSGFLTSAAEAGALGRGTSRWITLRGCVRPADLVQQCSVPVNSTA